MITISDKIITLTSDGTLIIFANRDEFADWAKDNKEDDPFFEVWANPSWLLKSLRRQEKQLEECYDGLNKLNFSKILNEGEISEATIRAIKAREDKRQQKIAEAKQ